MTYCSNIAMLYMTRTWPRWPKGCIFPFSKKGDFGIAENYWGITLTSIVAKIYIALLLNCIKPENSLEESKWFLEKPIHKITDSNHLSNFRRSLCKNLKVTLLLVDFSKVFDSIDRGENWANTSSLWSPQRNCHSHCDNI